ncbi:hypothetical protein ABFS82_03G029900 [Erythranthe guttata]|uniref:transcription factor bHLH74-like n=1 Tax=Erythranthe guttata TaxID=4155 RepID=UPI00064D839E|nr:PREDICTED: transcription factor bHLH74-like [Erythranthe guttata]|eukprot:XP_012841241.1 PREDICTED: transcription factor bHLH74-like [Erythranthe guttata]
MASEESGDNNRVFHQSAPFYGGSVNWDSFGNSNIVLHPNDFANQIQTMGSSSQFAHFPSDSGFVDIVSKTIPSFRSGSFSEMHTSLDCAAESDYSPYGKRKRGASPKNAEEEEEEKKDCCVEKSDLAKEEDEEKQKSVKKADNNSVDLEPSKENYLHMRAKRGQATNSHSLAERVRRERIGERMKLLQELVPGCNKITGKAMMLDEIINYVQSLQQQVEFLSMKLATVNPEVNVDIDRILSKDILHLRGGNITALGIAPSFNPSHPFQGTFNATPPFNPLISQHTWNNELQGILQMGFDPDPSNSSLGQNGPSRMEL